MNQHSYTPETLNYRRLSIQNILLMLVYHAASFIVYELFIGLDPVALPTEGKARVPVGMFLIALSMLSVMGIVLIGVYFKNSERKRAYLTATSVEKRGAENVAEGKSHYRKLALAESAVCAISTGVLWLIPSLFYTISVITSGQGFGYRDAGIHERFFVGFVGLCEPFQNAFVGLLLGSVILFVFHYFGRLYAHRQWEKNRIRH